MRRRQRNIEIFSISTLDLFASALGAFILVAIILFPYYLKDQGMENRIAIADKANGELHGELETAIARTAELQNGIAEARRAAGTPFLVVVMRWTTPGADVDLHVTDPAGHEFDWTRTNIERRDYPSSQAELSFDMTNGPAIELWQDPVAQAGDYRIDYIANVLPPSTAVTVNAIMYDRTGRHELAKQVLRKAGERMRGAVITIAGDGHVALR